MWFFKTWIFTCVNVLSVYKNVFHVHTVSCLQLFPGYYCIFSHFCFGVTSKIAQSGATGCVRLLLTKKNPARSLNCPGCPGPRYHVWTVPATPADSWLGIGPSTRVWSGLLPKLFRLWFCFWCELDLKRYSQKSRTKSNFILTYFRLLSAPLRVSSWLRHHQVLLVFD